MTNLTLRFFIDTFKNHFSGVYEERVKILIVDSEKGNYPSNFLCSIPKEINKNYSNKRTIQTIFPEKSIEEILNLAEELLLKAKATETNPIIIAEINRRLDKLRKPKIEARKCVCGKEFNPKTNHQKFCSVECKEENRQNYYKILMQTSLKPCLICGQNFVAKRRTQVFCSKRCRNKFKRKRENVT